MAENHIFIFENLTWKDLKNNFKLIDLNLNSGSITNRHILSTVEIRLARFLLCLDGFKPWPTSDSTIINKKIKTIQSLENYHDNEIIKDIKDKILKTNKYTLDEINRQLYYFYFFEQGGIFKIYNKAKNKPNLAESIMTVKVVDPNFSEISDTTSKLFKIYEEVKNEKSVLDKIKIL